MADTTQQMAAAEEKKEDAVPQQAKAHRMLQVSILRYNPADPDSVPHLQTYSVSETDSMTLYILLNELRDTQDPSLQFDFVCRAGICGSCAMLVNGKPTLACRCLTRDLPDHFTLAPLPGFELISPGATLTMTMSICLRLKPRWIRIWPKKSTCLTAALNAAVA